jgi:putative Holliday junction resolvase
MNNKKKRIVALDYGLVRIGIALSDELKIIATPLTTLTAEKKSEATVKKLLTFLQEDQDEKKYDIEEIIIGNPLLLSGKSGLLADEVKHFIELLQKSTDIPLKLWDERLTSVQAEKSMKEGNLNRKKRSKLVDKIAAVILLQSYLDSRSIQ